jgi:uncharacterized UPF0146 family protein
LRGEAAGATYGDRTEIQEKSVPTPMDRERGAMPQASTESHSPVVIVGAGFGGLTAAKRLSNTPFDITVADQHNHHLFQPLLHQVATASRSPADIASPFRGIHRNVDNVKVIPAKSR